LDAQWLSYTEISTYNGNRFGLTFFSNQGDLFGPVDNVLYPGIVIVLWLADVFLSLREIARLAKVDLSKPANFFITELFIFLSYMMREAVPMISVAMKIYSPLKRISLAAV
jgi:hypothetical protein